MNAWANIRTIAKREIGGYFASPVAYVFIVIFLLLCGFFTFMLGGFFERREASLVSFFMWLPWLYLFLVPAVAMRLWSEERRLGTMELLLTMPVTGWQAIVGKFLASWLFLALALALTFPVWWTVNYLGHPDNGVIVTAYLGNWLVDLVTSFSVMTHFEGFQKGVLDSRDIIFFLSVIGFSLFATSVILRTHRAG